MQQLDHFRLVYWFLSHRRSLPWRENSSPYAVWISEVMLQQTKVEVVIPYFLRWMETFPTIADLASAPQAEVLKSWEGLGYYSRARNLHEGAIYLVKHHRGKLPDQREALSRVKGIGPYTVGAILSFAFHKKAPAVDGNVMRVLCRFWGIQSPIPDPKVQKMFERELYTQLPDERPWEVAEALIELGALVCTKKPACEKCPLREGCIANNQRVENLLPIRKKNPPTTKLYRLVTIIHTDSHLLVTKRQEGKIMGGLWEFPYFSLETPLDIDLLHPDKKKMVAKAFDLPLLYQTFCSPFTHTFTRFKAFLYPHIWKTSPPLPPIPNHHWISFEEAAKKPFSSGHRTLLHHFLHQKGEDR